MKCYGHDKLIQFIIYYFGCEEEGGRGEEGA